MIDLTNQRSEIIITVKDALWEPAKSMIELRLSVQVWSMIFDTINQMPSLTWGKWKEGSQFD